jgi:hypothetical protein
MASMLTLPSVEEERENQMSGLRPCVNHVTRTPIYWSSPTRSATKSFDESRLPFLRSQTFPWVRRAVTTTPTTPTTTRHTYPKQSPRHSTNCW